MPNKSLRIAASRSKSAHHQTVNAARFKCRSEGTRVVWPSGVQVRYNISGPTRWRWEKNGKLPLRDVFVNGIAVGWRPETLDSAERGGVR